MHWAVIEGGSLPATLAEAYDGDVTVLESAWDVTIADRILAAHDMARSPSGT